MIQESDQGILLTVYIQPGSSQNEITGLHNGALKIKIQSPPVDGKANAAVLKFLCQWLNCAKKNVTLVAGEKTRVKKILLRGLSRQLLEEKIEIATKSESKEKS
jgi:uncharacterized protein (TIGR00251 family)